MLNGVCAVASTRIGALLMTPVVGLITFAFVVWGIGDIFQGLDMGNWRASAAPKSGQAYGDPYETAIQSVNNGPI